MIELDNITIQVGSRRFFAHTRWVMQADEDWAICGPAGSGKSLLGRAISRKAALVDGHIRYFFEGAGGPSRSYLNQGEILTFSAETHQNFLRAFASYHQARWQSLEGDGVPSAGDLLMAEAIQPGMQNSAEFTKMKANVVRMLRLEHLLERKVIHLSHGESRKLFLARMLMHSPKVLILDEPLVGLDEESRGNLVQAIASILAEHKTRVIYISSNAAEIPAGIEHILRLADCQILACGGRELLADLPESAGRAAELAEGGNSFKGNPAFAAILGKYEQALTVQADRLAPVFIQMERVNIRYGEVEVLKNVNWTVRQGERWALLGRNGAGKSTLLSLVLADNPQAYKNAISLFGIRRGSGESIWEIKRRIGWVSPELHIFYPPGATCREVVLSGFFDSAGLYQATSKEQSQAADGWLKALEMEALAETSFQALSAGQQRQVLLGRALVKNPPLLVLDEPCQGLDRPQARYFVDLIDQICAHSPLTLVYVSHYQSELPKAINQRLVLENGGIARS